MEKIVAECGIKRDHSFLELGFGRGRCCFWLSQVVGCKVAGVERIGFFYKAAKIISKIFKTDNLKLVCQDMLEFNIEGFDFIYMYGSSWDDSVILKLAEKFKRASKEMKIITISYPLSDYDKAFVTLKKFEVSFPWGKTFCFLNGVFLPLKG